MFTGFLFQSIFKSTVIDNNHEITFFQLQLQKYDIASNTAKKMRKRKAGVEPKNLKKKNMKPKIVMKKPITRQPILKMRQQ